MRKPTVPQTNPQQTPNRKEVILINRKDLPEANTTCKICGHRYRLCNRCLQLRSMGLESWREYCDCIECYQVYTVLSKDINDITREEFDYILSIELPVGQEYTDEVKAKFKEVKKHFGIKDKTKVIQSTQSTQVNQTTQTTKNEWKSKGQTANSNNYKKYDYGYDKKQSNKTQYKK